ncbi:signal recognition particle, SRP19 subunit [Pholiota conissans]|uniref:Signal recognition particle, SRP19 subunit n=1 Tax=Pholiota conissans TaxID=109636 RepID=A0A9P6D422_9AGAR|nr:signal recognition particle, SRP19 subunit [Pholiota conissans]
MSRRAAIVEEFDDDTDLPLPAHPLPDTGSRGPLLQELHISDDEFEPPRAGPASPPRNPFPIGQQGRSESGSRPNQLDPNRQITDITPYKSWTCIYPIYVDAKRPYGTGQRRVERAKSLWWPLSKDIADAANRLGLGTLHEVNKSHPRDWENPGRVRVQWKKDGKLMNPVIKTKKQLLEMICLQLQTIKPENVPKPPYNTSPPKVDVPPSTKGSAAHTTVSASSNKGKQPAATKSKSPAAPPHHTPGRQLPVPPEPYPPLASRVSPYSPAISTGVLVETVKAGMNATETNAIGVAPGAPGGPGGAAKGKRKVVRVRG